MTNSLNEIIKQKRKERGLSLREVSRILGISKSTLSRIENNNQLNKQNKNVIRLIDFYSIDSSEDYAQREVIDISDFSPVNKKLVYLIKEKEDEYNKTRAIKKSKKK